MPEKKEFHLKWWMVDSSKPLTDSKVPWWAKNRFKPQRVPRLVDIDLTYFGPGEYVHPLTQQPVEEPVLDWIKKIRVCTRDWTPGQRYQVDRGTCVSKELPDGQPYRWSSKDKKEVFGMMTIPLIEYGYEPVDVDRGMWELTFLSFLCANCIVAWYKGVTDLVEEGWRISRTGWGVKNPKVVNIADQPWNRLDLTQFRVQFPLRRKSR